MTSDEYRLARTAVHLAAARGHTAILQLLADNGAVLNAFDRERRCGFSGFGFRISGSRFRDLDFRV